MAITQGTKLSSNITAVTSDAGVGTAPDRRRLYNFGDRVAELSPEESPFFVYLSKVAKRPTSDPVFRFLENRSKTDWTSRQFYIDGAIGVVSEGSTYSFKVDDNAASPSSIDWLIKGMVFTVNTVDDTNGYALVSVRIETAPVDNGADTSFMGKIIKLSESNVTDYAKIADSNLCQVIGTAFAEGTGSPDAWSGEIEDDYGYTQIFKTAAEMSNTAIATKYRGYSNEWERIWNLKLREHKVDIERALLFGHKGRVGGIQYTDGVVGHIIRNSSTTGGGSGTALSYTSGKGYLRTIGTSEFSYDLLLMDAEVLFDPARGGSGDRLVLASLPQITQLNKMADGGFIDASIGSYQYSPFRVNMKEQDGRFGHKVMLVDTVHGSYHFVKEPLFRGNSESLILFADMSKLAYRPLVGNGLNRDTFIKTNVQAEDEDLRKDLIVTEAGLEVNLPECHMLYHVE